LPSKIECAVFGTQARVRQPLDVVCHLPTRSASVKWRIVAGYIVVRLGQINALFSQHSSAAEKSARRENKGLKILAGVLTCLSAAGMAALS
jgi:hypothetical protein